MTADELRERLAARGIVLDDRAFAAALEGARRLKAESARLAAWLDTPA